MAPIYVDPQAWREAANLPSLALLSAVILFILAITLLALCTSCERQSFTLDTNPTMERNSSKLVRVEKPGNPSVNSSNRTHLAVMPEDLRLGPNENFKGWRSHTIGTIGSVLLICASMISVL